MVNCERLSYALGAAITDIDIRGLINGDDVKSVQEIWHENHVVIIRGQSAKPQDIINFAENFGVLDNHEATPFYRMEGYPQLLEITTKPFNGRPSETRNVGRNWHSDYSYTDRPAAASMLFCVNPAPLGGDTMFCNMVKAYETLSDHMQKIVNDLYSVYDISLTEGFYERDPSEVATTKQLNPPIAHPAVRVHPSSGKRALYVSERVSHFHGMSQEESRPIIDFLCLHATKHENIYRHVWKAGDLVCWDNRTTMHVALKDFDQTKARHMLRATLIGEKSGFLV
ncbi:MAG: taurine dioxygenase [Rhodospirillaceae bacterium]|nr:taurine dioxygenase [Rhodospirillaceae bacterium]MDG1273986.1 TauD/TfdA family dioxygenase [Alphaproteobacteria bacterium]MDG1887524.1 TauD/TfdA family dioxygenase [Alphaproteobacteria bacterium]|tara:strand:+ start:589 stop:1437 length:849 start_codon:yes stop_codon:yes gene_type:complete